MVKKIIIVLMAIVALLPFILDYGYVGKNEIVIQNDTIKNSGDFFIGYDVTHCLKSNTVYYTKKIIIGIKHYELVVEIKWLLLEHNKIPVQILQTEKIDEMIKNLISLAINMEVIKYNDFENFSTHRILYNVNEALIPHNIVILSVSIKP